VATVKKGGGPAPGPLPPQEPSDATSRVGAEILKAKSAPKSEYMRPHRAHVSAERKAAESRHHAAQMEEEARKGVFLEAQSGLSREEELEEQQRVQGLNFDDERKKRGRRQNDENEDEPEDGEDAFALGKDAAQKGLGQNDGAGKYFQDLPDDRLGDLSLSNPNEMKRLLGPTVRFAQHAMLLAEERLKSGIARDEVIDFLASLYVGVADRAYAQKALREFGTGTGIIDIYPLELMNSLLENVPTFFNKVAKGRFFASSTTGKYKSVTGKPIVLTYDASLRIRGFALHGGPRPGYLFEPVDPPGTYHLTFQTPGEFKVLVSAISKNGAVAIEELQIEIAQGADASEEAAALKRERAHDDAGEVEPAAEPAKEGKKDDLTFHFPKRI
jgi:hypothetical protein